MAFLFGFGLSKAPRGVPSRHFRVAFSKNSSLGFCHLPIKLNPLNPKMAFLFGFGAPGRRRRDLQIGKLHYCTFSASPLAPLACLTKILGDQCKPGHCRLGQCRLGQCRPGQCGASGLAEKVQKCNFLIQGPHIQERSPFSWSGDQV